MKLMLITIILIFLLLIMVLSWCACASRPADPSEDIAQIKYAQDWVETRNARRENRKRRSANVKSSKTEEGQSA